MVSASSVRALLVLSLVSSTAARAIDVDDLNTALRKRHAPWTARDNPINRLSPDEQAALGGAAPAPARDARVAQPLASSAAAALGLPTRLDWRDNGGNFVTSVKNQGGCGSCWAFAAIAVAESALLIDANTPGVDLDLSEQFVLSCSGAGDCIGGVPEVAAESIAEYGARTELCFPYSGYDETCLHSCAEPDAVVRLRPVKRLPVDDGALKVALQEAPVTACFTIFDDFYAYGGGVYEPVSAVVTGAHAVELIGYDDAEGAWIAKNQWGTEWGEQGGYFRIKYGAANFGYCGAGFEKNRAPSVVAPAQLAVVGDDDISVPLQVKDPDNDAVTITVEGLSGAVIVDDALVIPAAVAHTLRGDFAITLTATDDWHTPASTSTTMTLSICNSACDDDNPCTADTCPTGECRHDNDDDRRCDDDGNACTDEACVAGACGALLPDDTRCDDDANGCTVDVCVAGVCTHDGSDSVGDRCDDGSNPCQPGSCDDNGRCIFGFVDGAACDDGIACTDDDVCVDGRCAGTAPAVCDDGIDCTVDGCDDKAPLFTDVDAREAPYVDLLGRSDAVDLRIEGDDVSTVAVPIGFAWSTRTPTGATFSASSLYVSSNALVSFTQPDTRFVPSCLPDGSEHAFIAAAWSDWRCDRADGCRVLTALVDDDDLGTVRVVQWHQLRSVLHKAGRLDVELLIVADGTWQVRVDRVRGHDVYNAAIGASFGADDGLTFTCGEAAFFDDLRVVPTTGEQRFVCTSSTSFDQCRTDDGCVATGSVHPDNSCLVCISDGYEPGRGATCDDGQRCTVNDSCDDGECRGTPPRACDDDLDCTIDDCADVVVNGQNAARCEHEVRRGFCMIDEACVVDGEAHPTDPCLVCDASVSTAVWSPKDLVACDDGDACTVLDECRGGVCTGTDTCGTPTLLALGEACESSAACASSLCAATASNGMVCCRSEVGCCVDDDDCAGDGGAAAYCMVDHVCRVIATPVEPATPNEPEPNDDDDDDVSLGGGGCNGAGAMPLFGVLAVALRRRRR